MQAVVEEIRVRDRGHIQPVFRVPIFGPPYGLVPPAGAYSNRHVQEQIAHLYRLVSRSSLEDPDP